MLVGSLQSLSACTVPPRRVERTRAPSTRPFDEFLRTTEPLSESALPPRPLWQVLERENLQRPHAFTVKGRMIDVLA
ncbi:MAG: hypothetical protein U0637_03525 [Phycisphaerales bacterium]